MQILIVIFLIYFSSQKSLNDIIKIHAVNLEQSVYDVNFIAYTFYLLQPNGIKLINNDYRFYFSKYSPNSKINLKETTSFVQVNGTNFFVACTKDYLLMNLYGGHLSNATIIEQRQIFPYEEYDISPNNQKCTVDSIDNKYVIVTYSYKDKNLKTNNSIYVFELDSEFNATYLNTVNFLTNYNLSNSYEETFGCVGLAEYKYLCIYLDSDGIYYFDSTINNTIISTSSSNLILNDVTQMKISKNHFDVNRGVFRYIIGMIDKDGNQYHQSLITTNSTYEFSQLNQIEYFGPTSVNSFSGFSKSISEYYPVFFGSDLLTMEHINNKDSIYTSVSFKPLKTIDVTFSSIIQPEVASKTYVIITGWENSYLYLIDYPQIDYSLKCSYSELFLGSDITYDLDITNNKPKISFDSSLNEIPIENINPGVTATTYIKNNIFYAQITTPEKLPSEKTNILFSFYEKNITPLNTSNPDLKPVTSKIESLYFFNPLCTISLSTCFISCKTCTSKGKDDSHLCTSCKEYYNFKEGQCQAESCGPKYALYSYKCILCPEQNGKWFYNESISENHCLYNSSSDCPKIALLYIPELMRCTNECPSDYSFIISSKNECSKSCPKEFSLILEGSQCVDKCPSFSELVNDTHCECISTSKKDSNGKVTCEEIKDFDKYNVKIGEDCLKILMEENLITDESLFHIFKKIIKREGGITNQIEYRILLKTQKGLIEVDTSKCLKTNVTVIVPIDESQIDNGKVTETFEAGFDIFNPKDSFYDSSNCTSSRYDNGDSNIPISKRKSDYFENHDFCEFNCKYNSFNLENMTVTCICPFKPFSLEIKSFSYFDIEGFYENNGTSSIMMKCFNSKDLVSAAFIAGAVVSIGQVAMLIYYLLNNETMYKNLLSAFMIVASPPRSNSGSNVDKNDVNSAKSQNINSNQNNNNEPHNNKEINENNINVKILKMKDDNPNSETSERNEENEEFDDMGPDFELNAEEVVKDIIEKPHLDEEYIKKTKKKCIRPKLDDTYFDLNFNQAIKKKLPFFHYYINLLYYNQMILFMITKDKWNYTLTKISLFLNVILFSMLFNTVFINDSLLIYINENEGDLCLNKAFGRIILAVILTIIVNCVLKLLGLTKIEFEGCSNNEAKILKKTEKPAGIEGFVETELGHQNEGNDDDIDNNIDNQLGTNSEESEILYYKKKTISKIVLKKHIFLRSLFYFIVVIPLTMFVTFYVSAFTSMYKKTRLHLFVYILISFLIIMFYPFALCAIICGIRYYGLNKNKEKFFKISKKIEWLILL